MHIIRLLPRVNFVAFNYDFAGGYLLLHLSFVLLTELDETRCADIPLYEVSIRREFLSF
jgi:hypothetical protein